MSWTQLVEWMDYAALEPFGPVAEDMRTAQIALLLAERDRDRKRRPQPYKLDDFMLAKVERSTPKARKPITDPKQWSKVVDGIMAAF